VARLLQGIAGSGGIVLSRAIARDLYQGHELTRFYALLMMINGVAPIGAPVLGGELLRLVDWRGIFAVLTAIVLLLTLASTLQVRETLPPQQRTPGGLRQTLQQIRQLLTLRPFMGLCLAQGFTIAGMFAYIGASSFVLQQLYGLTPQQFSLCFAVNGIGLILMAQVAARLSNQLGEIHVLQGGLILAMSAASLLVLAGLCHAPLPLVLICLFFSVTVNSIIGTTSVSRAMQAVSPESGGAASALLGLAMFALGALSVPFTGLGGTSMLTMSLTILGCYTIAVLLYWRVHGWQGRRARGR